MAIQLLNGAFEASQNEKGQWFYKANISKVGLKKTKPLSMKEEPQYKQIEDIEDSSIERYSEQNRKMVLDIANYLKSLI